MMKNRFGAKNLFVFLFLISLGLLPALATLFNEPFLVSLFSRILIYGIAAISLDLILGFGGMVSFGHAAFFGIGAYVVGIMSFHSSEASGLFFLPFMASGSENGLIVWPTALLTTAIFALIIGCLSLRTSGMHFIMITLAFAQMFFYFFVSLEAYGGDDGLSLYSRNSLPGIDLSDDTSFYYLCYTILVVYLLLMYKVTRSKFGMVIRGCKENEPRMRALGFHTYKYKLACFVISGTGAGMAGTLIANQTEYVSPTLMHWTTSGELMIMTILGGMGTLIGPLLGAITLLLLEEILAVYTEHWMVYLGPLLIIVILYAKGGLISILDRKGRGNA